MVIYLHGKAEVISWQGQRFDKLVSDGTGVLALSYRGYGGSTGQPTENGCIVTPRPHTLSRRRAIIHSASPYGAIRSAPGLLLH